MKSKIKSKPKPRPNPALKRVNNTLDLTVNDKEIDEIINTDKKQDKTKDDKLKAFLDALTKK
jgi:cobalamin biosynthesis protein CobT